MQAWQIKLLSLQTKDQVLELEGDQGNIFWKPLTRYDVQLALLLSNQVQVPVTFRIFPALFQKCEEHFLIDIAKLMKENLAQAYFQNKWKTAIIIFIIKVGKKGLLTGHIQQVD